MLIDVHITLFCLRPLKTKSIGSQYLPRFSWKYRLYFKGNLENHILFTVKYLEKNIVFNSKTWNFMILILYEPCNILIKNYLYTRKDISIIKYPSNINNRIIYFSTQYIYWKIYEITYSVQEDLFSFNLISMNFMIA